MVICFDCTNWPDAANQFVIETQLLKIGDISTIQKLFTSHVHQERFCYRHLAEVIDNSNLLTILQRLKKRNTQIPDFSKKSGIYLIIILSLIMLTYLFD
ncbi:DUF6508 domain-containing protein [Anabaena sp. 4-3]|uniref:DUF6508 domain-containing protein n=1 Tax=Anabaena sp. 4-3 TaxID=1811979 RepID=UPI000B2C9831|nr:DUF6508 domain-containing protein [Anabaena sp. 4-3]